jgi:hypothetical protein
VTVSIYDFSEPGDIVEVGDIGAAPQQAPAPAVGDPPPHSLQKAGSR